MSSRLIAPKVGATAFTNSTMLSVSFVARHSGNASTPANSLKSSALPSITGIAASGPMSPNPRDCVRRNPAALLVARVGRRTTVAIAPLWVCHEHLQREADLLELRGNRASRGRVLSPSGCSPSGRLLWRHLDAATSAVSQRATSRIAIVGLDRRHDRFGRPRVEQYRYSNATRLRSCAHQPRTPERWKQVPPLKPSLPCSSPAAGRRAIEGAHLLGDETGAASSTRRARCCDNTTNAGRREARQRECCLRKGCGSPPRPGVSIEMDDFHKSRSAGVATVATLVEIVRSRSQRHGARL